ncbi:hypothetical protein, partial [Anaerobiospirillum succiniciproducens]|uniref:hypothetical protein n=1 Tax=Anaerobiospirillum succiniciproducens TaxID=13335 RepID=UPI003F88BE00
MLENKISFLSRLKKNWTLYKQIIKEHLASLEQKANMQLYNGRIVYLKRIQATLPSGKTVYAYLGIDDDRRWSERKQIAKTADEDE